MGHSFVSFGAMSGTQKRRREQCEEQQQGSAALQRLKPSEPDLWIVCKYEGKQETLRYHSVIMAYHSNYFDTLLASRMQESDTKKTVTLEDVDPDLFRQAVRSLEDPRKEASATAPDIMKAAPIYNRFEFSEGLKLAESVLGKFLQEETKRTGEPRTPPEKKLIGDSILFSQEANLEGLTEKSISFIKTKLSKSSTPFDLALFDESFIQKIAPFLEEHKAACLTNFFAYCGDPDAFDLTASDFLEILEQFHWGVVEAIAFKEFKPLDLKRNGRLTIRGKQAAVDVHPSRWTTGSFEDGEEFELSAFRCTTDTKFNFCVEHVEIGDWYVCIEIGETSYRFVCLCSKSLPLPPIGNQWILAEEWRWKDDMDAEATFEIAPI